MKPLFHTSRIQNTSGTIGLLVDKYEAYGDIEDLKKPPGWPTGWQTLGNAKMVHT